MISVPRVFKGRAGGYGLVSWSAHASSEAVGKKFGRSKEENEYNERI